MPRGARDGSIRIGLQMSAATIGGWNAGGIDADDGRRLAVEQDRAADERGIAIEEPRPQRVADDGDRRAVRARRRLR